jgi:hypothetical protein
MEYDKPWTEDERDRWQNLVLGEGKPLQSGQTLDDDDDDDDNNNNNNNNNNTWQ